MNGVSAAVAPRSKSTASKYSSNLARSEPASASPNSLVTASKCISKLARLRPASLHEHYFQVHLQTCSITISECISKLARLRPASSHEHGLQVHLQTRSITASECSITACKFAQAWPPSASQTRSIKYIFKERRRLYGDTGVMEVDRVTGSIYSADPGVDRYNLISISSYHTMKIHTLSFPTFGLTRSVRDFVDPRNCVDPHGRVVSYLLTFLCSSSLM